jgi:two-component sensor histidine kinase
MTVSEWLSRRSRLRRHPILGCIFAACAVGAALSARIIVGDLITGVVYLTILPAVFATVALAGLRAGLVATALGGFGAWYVLMPPAYSFAFKRHGDMIAVGMYFFIAAAMCVLFEWMIRTLARQAALAELNAERAKTSETLKDEMEHRLRNQLQFVSGMLRLERKKISDPSAAETLERASERIQTIAKLHARLTRPDDGAEDFETYLRNLCRDVTASCDAQRVAIAVQAAGVNVPERCVLPISMIVCELVTNSVKHGVARVPDGEITVTMTASGFGDLRLEVRDNGPGLPADRPARAPGEPPALGLRLIDVFLGQLEGRMEVVPGAGAHFRITFPNDEDKGVPPAQPGAPSPLIEHDAAA